MEKLTVVIPTGGRGQGMYPLTAGMPKALIPIGTKPMLIKILETFDPKIIGKIIIVADKYQPMIVDYVDAFKHNISIPIIHKKLFLPPPQQLIELKNELSNPFIVHFTDAITIKRIDWQAGYKKYIELKRKDDDISGLLYVTRDYPLTIGVVRQDPQNSDYVDKFFEKPTEVMDNFVNMAIALFDKNFIQEIDKKDINLFGESVPRSISKGKKFTYYEHPDWRHFQRMGDWVDNQTKFYSETSS
jgi:NDP-sugar pyrophosphorylase family protein